MYSNIGGKIKVLAIIIFILGAVTTIIKGISMVDQVGHATNGLILMLLGPLAAWISTWLLYGFGELIEKTCKIAENAYKAEIKPQAVAPVISERVQKLQALRAQGLITEEEYQYALTKKSEV